MTDAYDDLKSQIEAFREEGELTGNTIQFMRGWGDVLIYSQPPKNRTTEYEVGYNAGKEALLKSLNLDWDQVLNLLMRHRL